MKKVTKSLRFILPDQQRTRQESIRFVTSKCIVAILLFFGISENLKKIVLPEIKLTLFVLIGSVGCIAITLFLDHKKNRFIGTILTLCWLVLYCAVLYEDLLNGLRLCGNHVGEILGQRFGKIYPIYSITTKVQDYHLCITLFLIPISVLLIIVCGYLAKVRDSVFSLLLIGCVIFCNAFLQIKISPLGLGFLILAQSMMFLQNFSTRDYFSRTCSKTYLYGTALMVVAIMMLGIVLVLVLSSYEKGPFAVAKKNVIRSVDRIRYGVDLSTSLPDGDFYNLQRYEPSSKTALEVTMEQPESLWLRGYVGSVYNGQGWSKDNALELYKYSDLFYWLHKDNFYGQKQLVDAALVSGKELVSHSFGMGVRNVGASSRNIYAPYEFYYGKQDLLSERLIGDSVLNNSGFWGKREYEYVALPNIVKKYPDVINGLYAKNQSTVSIDSFLHIETNYSEFVYKEYTKISKKTKIWMNKYLTELDLQKENVNFTSAKQAIITYLTEKTTYTTNPAKSSNGDFAYDFLFSNRTGYSVHYATAATLMFRYLGIPARYVEGYLITPKDVKNATDHVLLKLDGTHSHAWTEVYLDGTGWIPVEVTPPYFGLMEEADSFEGVQGGSYDSNEGDVKEKDHYKVQDDILDLDETEGIKNTHVSFVIIIIAVLIIVLLVWIFIHCYIKRKKWIDKRLKKCTSKENSVAVSGMFLCIMECLILFGMENDRVWLINNLNKKAQSLIPDYSKEYEVAFHIFEKAFYSCNEVSDIERETIKKLMFNVFSYVQEQSHGIQSFKFLKQKDLFKKLRRKEDEEKVQ